MSWRPKDWKNPHSGKTPELVFPQCCVILEEVSFEAGADAILETLRSQNLYDLERSVSFDTPKGKVYGRLVFIPEEKNESIQSK